MLNIFFPVKIISGDSDLCLIISTTLFVVYWLITIPTVAQMIRNSTSFGLHGCTTTLLKSGFFRYSRNPLYFSLFFLMASIAFYINSVWLLVMIPFLLLSLDRLVVIHEERFLEERFGKEFLAYKSLVRRWI